MRKLCTLYLLVLVALHVPLGTAKGANDDQTWLDASDKAWRAYIEPMLPVGKRVAKELREHGVATFGQPEEPLLRDETFKMLYSEIGAAYLGLLYTDVEYPRFYPIWGQAFNNNGSPNADTVYHFAPLDENGIYRVSGDRGSVRFIDFQIGFSTLFTRGEGAWGPSLANYDADASLHLGKNGSFEFILSATRPEGYAGDWLKLVPKTNYLVVRQVSYDWANEIDGRLAIERLDRPAARPRQDSARIQAALKQIPTWMSEQVIRTIMGGDLKPRPELVNKIIVRSFTDTGAGLGRQVYPQGFFDLSADEALIVEFDSPQRCRYWSLQLHNELWNTLDIMNRQVSLNGFMAKADSDGRYRFVISSRDPGVPNWLDDMGYRRGVIFGRLEKCEGEAPSVTMKKVGFAEVRANLPTDTPTVTAEEREATLRWRSRAAQMRRKW